MSRTRCFCFIWILSSLLSACAAESRANPFIDPLVKEGGAPRVSASRPIHVRIYINTYGKQLGAFDLEVHYNEQVGRVSDSDAPSGGPNVEFFKWRRGKHRDYIRLEGFYSKTGPVEERQVHVATIMFYREHDGRCDVKVEPLGVYDLQGKDIKGAVSLHANPPILFFEK